MTIPLPEHPLRHLLLATLILAVPVASNAQQLEPGARIRVRLPCEEGARCYALIGNVRSVSSDTLVMERVDGGLESFRLTPDTRVDVSHGHRRRVWEGLGVGLAAGIVAGFIGKEACEGPYSDDSLCGLYYLITVPPGLLVGGIVGAHLKVEWWLPAEGPRFTVVPVRGGVGVGLALGF